MDRYLGGDLVIVGGDLELFGIDLGIEDDAFFSCEPAYDRGTPGFHTIPVF